MMDLRGLSLGLLHQLKVELRKFKENDISVLLQRVSSLESNSTTLQNKINNLESELTAFKTSYNSHDHDYEDETISDTADGTGVTTTTNKTTGGPN